MIARVIVKDEHLRIVAASLTVNICTILPPLLTRRLSDTSVSVKRYHIGMSFVYTLAMPSIRTDKTVSWSEALAQRRKALKMTQEDVAAATTEAVSQGTVSDLERGRVHPFKLETGRMIALASALKWTFSEFQRATGLSFGNTIEPREDKASLVGFHLVPIIGVAEAGFPETYPVPNRLKRPGTRVFQVHGESMNGGNKPILDGDHLLVDINQTDLQEGKVFVIEIIGNGHCVKRARNRKGEWWLESDNTEFASYAPEEAVIFGRVYYKMSGDDL